MFSLNIPHIHFSLKLAECVCFVCVVRMNLTTYIGFSSQNLDNCRVFSMISLQFSIINIFLSFRGYIQFHSDSSEFWERKKERKRERVWFERLESHKFIGIFWCDFDMVSQRVCVFLGIWEMNFENFFILDSITLCSIEGTFWVFAVTFGWRSWCDCQNCEMRERWK